MNMCIYTKSSSGEFKSQEHIIPAFLGGRKMLPKGYVKDDINNNFSKSIEDYLSHQSIITAIRNIKGPGKRGKTDFLSQPMVAYNSTNSACLVQGNINGVSVIPQIIIRYKLLHFDITYFSESVENQETYGKLLIDKFINLPENLKSVFIEDPYAKEGRYIVSYCNNKWFISGKTKKTIAQLRFILEKGMQTSSFPIEDLKIDEELDVNNIITHDEKYNRGMLKILFNFLADYCGQEFVLNSEFDLIRNFIVSGNRSNLIKFDVVNGVLDDQYLRNISNLHRDTHFIILDSYDFKLTGIIMLYGEILFSAELLDNFQSDLFTVFYCDWKNRNEGILIDGIEWRAQVLFEHENAYKEQFLNDAISTGTLFGKELSINCILLMKKTQNALARLGLNCKFYYDSSIIKQYTMIVREVNTILFYIDTKFNSEVFNALIEQGCRYIELSLPLDCYAAPLQINSEGEKEISNYINMLTTFTLIDKKMKQYTNSLDKLYMQMVSSITSKIMNYKKNNSLNEFLIVSLSLQISIIVSYDKSYYELAERILGDFKDKIMENVNYMVSLIDNITDDNEDRKHLISNLILALNIENHIQLVIGEM